MMTSGQEQPFPGEGALLALGLVTTATVYVVASLSPWPQPARALVRSWQATRRFGGAVGGRLSGLLRASAA